MKNKLDKIIEAQSLLISTTAETLRNANAEDAPEFVQAMVQHAMRQMHSAISKLKVACHRLESRTAPADRETQTIGADDIGKIESVGLSAHMSDAPERQDARVEGQTLDVKTGAQVVDASAGNDADATQAAQEKSDGPASPAAD